MAFFLALLLGIRCIIFLKSLTLTCSPSPAVAVMSVTVTVAYLSEQKQSDKIDSETQPTHCQYQSGLINTQIFLLNSVLSVWTSQC